MILIDNVKVDFGLFPNGESNLNFNNIQFHSHSKITLKFENDKDLFNLFILKQYLDEQIDRVRNLMILEILYMPYSRMDRHNDFYTFNLKYVANFINQMNFHKVIVFDAHSDVTTALLNKCGNFTNIPALFNRFQEEHDMDNTVVFYPDAGAQKRYDKDFRYPTAVGMKARDFSNGSITSYDIYGEVEGKDVVIIDDLCSRGGTFINAAKALKKQHCGKVYLIVGHCEDNVYTGDLLTGGLIEKVYTTNSILTENKFPDKMVVLDVVNQKKKKEN